MKSKILATALLGLLAIGCTRKASDTSTLSFSLPPKTAKAAQPGQQAKVFANATETLVHVIVNVTGSEIAPVYFVWDKNSNITGGTTFSTQPLKKSTVLVQVLAAYKSDSNDALTLYYKDVTQTLTLDVQPIEVNLEPLPGSSSAISGQISGRYLTSGNAGPTGDIAIKYSPQGGKPKMLIEKSSIFNGWFSVFALSNVAFEYEIQSGPAQPNAELMFGGPVSLASSVFNPADSGEQNRRMRAAMPIHLRNDSWSGTPVPIVEDAQLYVWGYWGNATAKADSLWANRSICRSSLSGPLTRMKKFSSVANWGSQPGLNIVVNSSVSTPMPTVTELRDESTPKAEVVFSGGVGNCSTPHTAGTKYSNWMSVSPAMIDGRGNDGATGFELPFSINANLNWATISTADPRIISADLLPGAGANIDEYRLFKKTGVNSSYSMDQIDCTQLSTMAPDYISAGNGSVDNAGHFTLNSNISAAEASAGTAALMCFYKNSKPYALGVFLSPSEISGASNGNGNLANHIDLEVPTYLGSSQYLISACVPARVKGLNASNLPANFPSGTNLNLSTSNGGLKFYTDSYCGTEVISPVTNVGGTSQTYYFKGGTGGQGFNLTATATGAISGTSTKTIGLNGTPGTKIPVMVIRGPANILRYTCYTAEYENWHYDGTNPPILLSDYVYATLPSTDFQFFSGSGAQDCTGYPTYSVSMGSSQSPRFIAGFVYNGTSSTATIQPASGWSYAYDGGQNIPVTQPGAATAIAIPSVSIQEGQCAPVPLTLVDSNGNTTAATSTAQYALTKTGTIGLYSDYNCSNSTSSVEIASGATKYTLYMKSLTQGAPTVTATSGAITGTATITIGMPLATSLLIVSPGDFYDPTTGVFTPSPSPALIGEPYDLRIFAVKYDQRPDPTFNDPKLISLGSGNITLPAYSSVNFTNGFSSVINGAPSIEGSTTIYATATGSSGQTLTSNPVNVQVVPKANTFKIYMNQASALTPGACQIFAVIPEDPSGFAGVPPATTVSLSSSTGSIYTDKDCTTAASSSFVYNPSDRVAVFFYKNPTASAAGTITTSATGYTTANLNITVAASGTVSAAYKWQILGRGAPDQTIGGRCLPYLAYLADSNGMYVKPGADVTDLHMHMGSLSGTTGAFTDAVDCGSPYLDTAYLTLTSFQGYRQINAGAPSWNNGAQRMNVGDWDNTYQASYLDLYRSN